MLGHDYESVVESVSFLARDHIYLYFIFEIFRILEMFMRLSIQVYETFNS